MKTEYVDSLYTRLVLARQRLQHMRNKKAKFPAERTPEEDVHDARTDELNSHVQVLEELAREYIRMHQGEDGL